MTTLPAYASLGRDQPQTRVLEWYLACTHPREYDRVQSDLRRGVELIHPIPAFEAMIRRNSDAMSYRDVLERAQDFFPRAPGIAREAARWMTRWEPELSKSVGQRLAGNEPLDGHDSWSADKITGYALLMAHMGAVNWESPALVNRWASKMSYLDGASDAKRQEMTAKAYWRAIGTLPSQWQSVVTEALENRCPEAKRESLVHALEASREKAVAVLGPREQSAFGGRQSRFVPVPRD